MKYNLEELFLELGFKKIEYKYIRSSGILMLYSDAKLYENLKDGFLFFEQLGFEKDNIIKFYKFAPNIIKFSYDELFNQVNKLIFLGYNQNEILKMINIDPRILTLNDDEFTTRFYILNRVGYTNEDIIKIGKRNPQIFTMNSKYLNDKIYYLLSQGYSKEEVVNMTKKLSSIFIYSIDNLDSKIKFCDFLDAHDLPVKKPNILIQSSNVSYSRYYYFIDKNISFEQNDYKKIFMSEKQFQKQYGITKYELIDRYSDMISSKQKSININY